MCDFPFFGCFWKIIFFLGDSENDLKIHVSLAAVESAVAVDMDADVDADSRYKDLAKVDNKKKFKKKG